MNVYFDNAATTPLRKEVIKTISRVMEECFGNPSSTHSLVELLRLTLKRQERV